MEELEKRELAWVGDAVLSLFAREWILIHGAGLGGNRTELFRDLTCNQFLSSFGEPTAVEAKIGVLYQKEGLAAANAWLEKEFIPVFLKQQKNKGKMGR
jgi:23S rRNA maturation mini-RNase III